MVSLEGIQKATSGKISFSFRNLSFCVSDLVIEGKYDRGWANSQIAKLRKEGKLKVQMPDTGGEKQGGKAAAGSEAETDL